VANETLGGRPLLEAVQQRAQSAETEFFLVVPQNKPRHGNVVHTDAVRDAAQIRVDLAMDVLGDQGIKAAGEVGDPDPFTATMDAVGEIRPDEIIVSTYPVTSSGWLRRDLVERIEHATGLPVQHVVVDLDQEGLPFTVTLVVANRTVRGEELIARLKAKAAEGEHLFIVVVPQESRSGADADAAQARLGEMLQAMRGAGLVCAGMIADPDPYTATMNALQSFRVGEVVISTLPQTKSGWLRGDLIERVRRATAAPVEHVVVELERARA